MTIDEAIINLKENLTTQHPYTPKRHSEAKQLGIEALEFQNVVTPFLQRVKGQIEIEKQKLEDNGFVIDNLEDRWQKLAFTLYTDIAALSIEAEQIILETEEQNDRRI